MTRRWRVRPANRPAGRQVSAKLTDEGSFVSCPARRQCPPNTTAALAATYPLRCSAPQWARFDNRHSTSAPTSTLTAVSGSGASGISSPPNRQQRPPPPGIVSRPGASAFFVSDGPISSNSGRNGGKNAGRNCVSALPQRAMPGSDLLRILAGITVHHRCQSKGLRVRSPARRLTRPLAPATAGVFRSYRRTPQSLPPGGAAVLNDRPVACQIRGPTDPQGDRCQRS